MVLGVAIPRYGCDVDPYLIAMNAMGVDIQTMNAEYGEGQMEITYGPKYGIEGPDASFTFKNGVKEILHSPPLHWIHDASGPRHPSVSALALVASWPELNRTAEPKDGSGVRLPMSQRRGTVQWTS